MSSDTFVLADPYPSRPGDVSVPPASGIHHRWSPVRFATDREVETGDLTAILEAARWSASCFGEEPWRFLVARRTAPWREKVEHALADGNAWARRASLLLVGVTKRTFSRNDKPNDYARHDLGMALKSMMVEAAARGLVTHAMAGFDAEAVREDFQVPEDYDPAWALAVGHYDPELDDAKLAGRDGQERGRTPLVDLLFGARFGETPTL